MSMSGGSIARRTLVKLAVRVALIIFAMTSLAYFHIFQLVTETSLEKLEKYTIERQQRERHIFQLAEENHETIKAKLLKRLKKFANNDPKDAFNKLFTRFPDGVIRNRLENFDGTNQSFVYIDKSIQPDSDLRRRIMAFYEIGNQYGPAWMNRFENLYFTTPENILVGYYPDVPNYAHESGPDLNMLEEEWLWIADKEHDPLRETVWTGTLYDPRAELWLISSETPVDVDGQHIATIGQDFKLNDLMHRSVEDHLEGAYNIIFRKDGRLIAHPKQMEVIKAKGGAFNISESNDSNLNRIFNLVINRDDKSIIIENTVDDEFLSVGSLDEPDWFFVTVYPKSMISGVAFEAAQIVLILGFLSLLAELVIFYLIIRHDISIPLQLLISATDEISDGNLQVSITSAHDDEIGLLSNSFNKMAFSIEEKTNELRGVQADLEKRVAERTSELLKSERGLAKAQKLAHIGSWEWDIQGNKLNWSEETFRLFELDPAKSEPDFEGVMSYIHPDDVETLTRAISRTVEQGIPLDLEYKIITNEKNIRAVHALGEVINSKDGSPLHMYGTIQDITDNKKKEEDLRKLTQALEQSPNALFITDLNGNIEYINPKFTDLTGYTREESIGKNPRILKSEETPRKLYSDLWRTIRRGDQWKSEIMDRHKNGSYFWAYETVVPVKDEQGFITNYVATHEDITERKNAELAAQSALEQAEIANRAKSELMANMSHELRTPLNAIIGFSETMKEETFGSVGSDKNREYLDDIHLSGLHLLELINDILDVSAIEANALELHEENVNIAAVIEASVRLVKPRAETGRITITTSVNPEISMIHVDERRFKQVLLNLLSNAIKFSQENGEVSVNVNLTEDGPLAISVSDNGIGMNEDEIKLALSSFGQVDSGLNRMHEGTGLGLPLTKGLMELHGGYLEINSEKGKGTKITVFFPKERILESETG